MLYEITKTNTRTGETRNYGSGYTLEDVKRITTGYKLDCELNPEVNNGRTGKAYTRKNSAWIFIVKELPEPEPEKKYWNVSFEYSEGVYCANIAHAVTAGDVERHYAKYQWCKVTEATPGDVGTARKKGMPVVEVEATPEAPEEARQETAPETVTEAPERPETITDSGRPATNEDRQALIRQELEKASRRRMDRADNSQRKHELREEIRFYDHEIMEAMTKKPGEERENLIEDLQNRRKGAQVELDALTTKDGTQTEYATGADWLQANATLKTFRGSAEELENLKKSVMAPINAMLYSFTRKFKTRESWDIMHITESGKTVPTQSYDDYVMSVYAELYNRCIDHPNDTFSDLLFIATKVGIYDQWKTCHHSRKEVDRETGETTYRSIVDIDITEMIWNPGNGSDSVTDDGETPDNVIMTDAYQNTAGQAINNVICDEICRDRKPEDLRILRKMATGEEIPSNSADEKRRQRIRKRIRSEYPEYIIRTEDEPRGRVIVLPWIKYKHYLPPITKRITAGEYAGTVVRYYKPGSLTMYKAGDKPGRPAKEYRIDHRTAGKKIADQIADTVREAERMEAEQERKNRPIVTGWTSPELDRKVNASRWSEYKCKLYKYRLDLLNDRPTQEPEPPKMATNRTPATPKKSHIVGTVITPTERNIRTRKGYTTTHNAELLDRIRGNVSRMEARKTSREYAARLATR